MAMPQRDDPIDEIQKTDVLPQFANCGRRNVKVEL